MSGGSIWSELGVAPTATESELKKAYARKLRVTQPEDDPDGFVRLRQAYEAALTYVRSGAALYEYDEDDETASNDTDWPSESQVSHYRPDSLPSTPPSFAAVPEAPELSADGQDMQRANAVFSQASQTFIDGLKHGEGETQLVLLFRDVMQASKQVDLETASAMPRWMAQCLLHFAPASDAILPFTIKYFGWDDEIDPGDDADVIYAILARQRFVGELWDLQSDDHALSAAWIELTAKKSTMARRFGAFFKPELAIKVRTLLDRLDYDLYGLADQVRDDAVTWWRAFLAKPRMYWTHILLSYFGGVGWLPSLLMFKDNATDVVSGLVSIAASLFLIPATPLAILWLQNKNPAWQPGGVQPWHRWLDTYWIATLFLVPPIAWLTASNSSLQNLLVLPVLLAMAAIIVTGDYQRPQSIRQLIKAKAVRFIWPFWVISIVEAGSAELKAGHFALAVASAVLCVMAKNTGGQLLCERWTQYIPKYAASSFLLLAIIYLAAAIALAINTPVYAGYRLVLAVHIAIVVINLLPYLSDADWAKTVLGWGWIALVAIILFASPMLKSANSARALAEPAILSDIPAPALSGLANADADLDLILANFKQSGIDVTSIKQRNPAVWKSLLNARQTAKNNGATNLNSFGNKIGALIDREYKAASKKMSYKQQRQWIENDVANMKVARAYSEQDCLGYFNGVKPKLSSAEEAKAVKRQRALMQDILLNPTTEKTRNRAKPSRQFTPALSAGIAKRTGFSVERTHQLLTKQATNKDGCDARIALFETLLTLPEAEAKPLFQGLIMN